MKLRPLIFALITLLSIAGCNNSGKGPIKPSVTGSAGDLLVIIDKAKWESTLGDTIKSFLAAPIPTYPSGEPYFTLTQVQDDNLTDASRRFRSILFVTIKPGEKTSAVSNEDVWAAPQTIISLTAPNVDSMINLVARNGLTIRDKFVLSEIERWSGIFKKTFNTSILNKLKEKYQITLNVPQGYSLDVTKKDFFWISGNSRLGITGIIGWTYPFTSKDQLKVDQLVEKRNEVLKENVQGEVAGSYMLTEDMLKPVEKEFIYNGRYFARLDGLWKMHNEFMGGPFVSLTTVDDANKRIITVEAFFHSPEEDKRNTMRQLEGSLYTLQVINNK